MLHVDEGCGWQLMVDRAERPYQELCERALADLRGALQEALES